jgi:NADPH-dependent curcumin reductase
MSEPAVTRENFRLEEVPLPELPQGGLLLRVLYLSLDPYMRGRMDDRKSYAKPVRLGEVMTGESVCEVIASDQAGYAVGDIVLAQTGCRTHAASAGAALRKLDPAVRRSPPDSACSVCPVSAPMRVST